MKHPQPFCFIQQNEVYSQIETSTLNFIALTEKKKKKKKRGKESTENTTSEARNPAGTEFN